MKLTFAPHLHGANFSLKSGLAQNQLSPLFSGGEGEIRTHGTRKGSTVFETARFNHSRTSPAVLNYFYYTLSRTSSALHRRQNRDGFYGRGRRFLRPAIQPRIY